MLDPIGDRVIIKPELEKETTDFGLVLSDTNRDKPVIGTIIEMSPKCTIKNLVSLGDKVIFKRYAQTEHKEGDDIYYIVESDFILGLIQETND